MQDAIILYENGKAIGGEGHLTDADDITFDNSDTDLVSENVGSAIKEVNAKSAKSADLTSISESGTTASQAISVGTYFYLNGTLVRAKTAIASGATFTLNTNYTVITAGVLNAPRTLDSTQDTLSQGVAYTTPSDGVLRIYIASGSIAFGMDGVASFTYTGAQTVGLYLPKGTVITPTTLSGSNGLKFLPYR